MEDKTLHPQQENRKPQQIEVRFKTQTLQKRKVKTWTPLQDQLLFQMHQRYPKKWNKIAQMMKNRNENQCLHRYRRLVQVGQQKKIWSPEEDKTVLQMVQSYGNNWKFIAAKLQTKTGKQIRQRYINKLDPSIKRQEWSQAEDVKVIELYTKHGSKWCQISKGLPGRPENRIKNRFYSYIQKNYDILVKDEGTTHTNQMTPQQSHELKSQRMFQKNLLPSFIFVSHSQDTKKQQDSNDLCSQNKENKDIQHSDRMEKIHVDRHYRNGLRKQFDEQCYKERSLQQINEPNEITYSCNHANDDLLYFEED